MNEGDCMPAPLRIALFADGANRDDMIRRYREGIVRGFTTNPTLMAKAGLRDYEGFARSVLAEIKTLPISFEVFSDEFDDMERQALAIASWAENVNVKIPITNTRRESALELIRKLLTKGVRLNVTAVMAPEQWRAVREIVLPHDDVIISIFAGRIADTGTDPIPLMVQAVHDFRALPGCKVLWASPREVLNIYQADACGCHIITATDDLIARFMANRSKNLTDFSLETVKMFYSDALKAGFQV